MFKETHTSHWQLQTRHNAAEPICAAVCIQPAAMKGLFGSFVSCM